LKDHWGMKSTIQFTATPRSVVMTGSEYQKLCVHRNRIAAIQLTVPTDHLQAHRARERARWPRWDMSRRLKAILARLNFRHNLLRSVPFPSLSTLSFSVSKSHPKGPSCLTMRLTIKPSSRYPSISPLSPFHSFSSGLF
jgi:hypothetical protein